MNFEIENTIWSEKYRPKTLDEYVGNIDVVTKVKRMIENNDVSTLLLHGKAGTGKTSLAKLIVNNMECEYIYINASDENSVDTVRTKIKNFVSTVSLEGQKIVILDESDFLSASALAALRGVIVDFSATARFILTCNYIEKIIDPIRSRCFEMEIFPMSKQDIAKHLVGILKKEKVTFEMKDLGLIIKKCYPDIRKIINTCQNNTIDGIMSVTESALIEQEYMKSVIDILTKCKGEKVSITIKAIRQVIADSRVRDFQDLYRYLYDNVDIYAGGNIASLFLVIAESQYYDALVVDKEINVMGMFSRIVDVLVN